MTGAAPVVAIIGATGLVGEALCDLLIARSFPCAELLLVASSDSAGTKREIKGSYVAVLDLATFDFTRAQLVFFAVPGPVASQYIPEALAAGCRVIDTSPRPPDDASGVYIVPEINGHLLSGLAPDQIVFCPDPTARILSLLIHTLDPHIDITKVHAVAHEPVSRYGRKAVDELAKQNIALFNMKEVPTSRFPVQVAFNLMVPFGTPETVDNYLAEQAINHQTALLTGHDQNFVTASRVLVPVFNGIGITVQITSTNSCDPAKISKLFSTIKSVKYLKEKPETPGPTALTHGSGTDFVCIGNLRMHGLHQTELNLFAVADNIRFGVALNCALAGEILANNSF